MNTEPFSKPKESLKRADRLARRIRRLSTRIDTLGLRLETLRNYRLAAGLAFSVSIFALAVWPSAQFILPLFVAFFAIFWTLVRRTRDVSRHLNSLRRLRLFFDRQERRCRGLSSGRTTEAAQKHAERLSAIRDLGLVGTHSLWSLIDETMTDLGQTKLMEWICRPPLPLADILKRQGLIQNLRGERWFFTRWGLSADTESFRLSSSQVLAFLKKPFVHKPFGFLLVFNWLMWIAAVTGLAVAGRMGWGTQVFFLVAFAATSLLTLMKVDSPFLKGVGLSHHLSQLAPIFEALESRTRVSEPLQLLAPVTLTSGPSREARKLNRVLAFMSVQANPLVHILINSLLPWSMTAFHFLERRRRKIAYNFPQALEELAELECLASLVIFDQYQTRTYPRIIERGRARPMLSFTSLYHPLIERAKVIENGFSFPQGKNLGLITGSNMSGKSTFLRTVGLNQMLANLGAPVFASDFECSPMLIETCIEVSDSLRDGYSYFYAEVRRLKRLLDTAKSGESVLFLIDEIFRGTNNRERHVGSRAVIRALTRCPHAIGFISTHDLELTELERTQETVLNLHFREDFSASGEMLFSYQLHLGPCPTTNALKIMEAEGIEIEDA